MESKGPRVFFVAQLDSMVVLGQFFQAMNRNGPRNGPPGRGFSASKNGHMGCFPKIGVEKPLQIIHF